MKKIALIIFAFVTLNALAQTNTTAGDLWDGPELDSAAKSLDCYVAGGISMSGGNNFKQNSYPSLELGVYFKNLAVAFNMGRSNFDKSTFGSEKIDNYYYELKTIAYFPIGGIKGYVIGGMGQYYNSAHSFIEYGGGIVYSISKVDLILQVSNWDRQVYLSPGIIYNFKL